MQTEYQNCEPSASGILDRAPWLTMANKMANVEAVVEDLESELVLIEAFTVISNQ